MSTISPDPMPLHHIQGVARRVLSQTIFDRYAPAFAKMYSDPDRRAQAWRALLDRERRQLELVATSVSRPELERAQAQMKLALLESQESPRAEPEQETAPDSDRASDTPPSTGSRRRGRRPATARALREHRRGSRTGVERSGPAYVAGTRGSSQPIEIQRARRRDHRETFC